MTATLQPPQAADRPVIPHVGVPGLRLVRSEIRKIATTNAWWLFGIASTAFTGLALWINMAEAAEHISRARDTAAVFRPGRGLSAAELAQAQAEFAQLHDLHLQATTAAGNIFTSGQFFGLLLVMLMGALVITNEFQYQTATATFLTTPQRTRVVFGKLLAVLGLGLFFWLLSRALSFVAGLIFFHNIGLTNSLTEWPVQRAIIFNLVAYLLWALLGFGLGTLIHSQIGVVVTAMLIYLGGFIGGIGVFNLIRAYLIHGDWVLTSAVVMPSIASQVMVSPEKLYPEAASWWVGVLVLTGWSVVAGAIGIVLNRRRDIT
ncbi:MAG: ABC transporter permease [Hamadaea sp.]|uniref:ABC transporter permease n=1 Tax=Hamadaea sp. TaxID=2024425 RepID=UPI0017AF7086|nr:ABC transporter permease [Hamadaea sp.]NUR69975.1 ABC transporter permease [Hamadaea sp.]NUT20643.1 ABC transporter permease [Hamadaea sp.]